MTYSPKRPIRIEGAVAYVPLTQGYEAVIDAVDAPLVENVNWCASVDRREDGSIRGVYALGRVSGTRRAILLHRMIVAPPEGEQVDHHDGDGLNCRRYNMRTATHTENMRNARKRVDNASGSKGVSWNRVSLNWQVHIRAGGRQINLGRFADLAQATAAYSRASAELHGDFGRLK